MTTTAFPFDTMLNIGDGTTTLPKISEIEQHWIWMIFL